MDGAVRLVPLDGIAPATATCDEVHLGAVELFRDGIWGRICIGQTGNAPEEFTLDAQVVCRQLGFPFGSVMDGEALFFDADYRSDDAASEAEAIIWATEVPYPRLLPVLSIVRPFTEFMFMDWTQGWGPANDHGLEWPNLMYMQTGQLSFGCVGQKILICADPIRTPNKPTARMLTLQLSRHFWGMES